MHVMCNLPLIYLSIMSCSLHWLVENNFPVVQWAFSRPFFKAHHDSPKFLTTDRLSSSQALSRNELRLLLNEKFYCMWQQPWESSDTVTTARSLIPLTKDRTAYSIDLNFFLTQALTGHGCLREYLYHF